MTWYILGAGTSGLAAARLCSVQSVSAVLTDQNSLSDDTKAQLKLWGTGFIERCDESFFPDTTPEGLILSPGVPVTHPFVQKAKKLSVPVLSETDYGLQFFDGRCLAVTGTNGKSTTVSLITHILKKAGLDALVCGNIGTPVCDIIASGRHPDWLVLELSSYQLEQASALAYDGGLFLNFSSDHLQRHGTLKQYFKEKWKLFNLIKPGGSFFAPRDVIEQATSWDLPGNSSVSLVETDWEKIHHLTVPKTPFYKFEHNLKNALASAQIANIALKQSELTWSDAFLEGFSGLSHRCELITTIRQRQFINDSKATNVDSTLTALESLESPVILMLGGQGKGESFLPIKPFESRISYLITFGFSGEAIARELELNKPHRHFKTLKDALKNLSDILSEQQGDVLLSPGCASFDEFKNFEQRGECFRDFVLDNASGY